MTPQALWSLYEMHRGHWRRRDPSGQGFLLIYLEVGAGTSWWEKRKAEEERAVNLPLVLAHCNGPVCILLSPCFVTSAFCSYINLELIIYFTFTKLRFYFIKRSLLKHRNRHQLYLCPIFISILNNIFTLFLSLEKEIYGTHQTQGKTICF